MPDFLQDYLHEVPQGLDSLLSLIPAKNYYVEDAGDTYNKPKQTKAEAAAARRAKLDPDSKRNRNVKEQWDEEQKNKRKADELDDDEAGDEEIEAIEGIDLEKPGEGLKKKAEKEKATKKQKTEVEAREDEDEETKLSKKAQKQEAKKEAKKAKKAAAKEKNKEKKKEDEEWETEDEGDDKEAQKDEKEDTPKSAKTVPSSKSAQKGQAAPTSAPVAEAEAEDSTPESAPQSPTFDTTDAATTSTDAAVDPAASTSTSVSSTIPPSEKPKHIKVPADTTALRARLAAKIESLRAARHADGSDGKPIRTRQELIEMRRKKQEQRKERKQELRKQAKAEAEAKREEALASNSPSVMSPAVELDESGFSFGRVAFGDGTKLSHDLSYVLNNGKKKGPSDPKTALLKVQNAKKRLEEMSDEKRKDIEDKDTWLTARRRVAGEKIRDDENILKKAVKRKEVAKKKSEKAWKDRAQSVQKSQWERQKKRTENLQKKRDEKNAPKGKKKKKAAAAAGAKKGGRPGFEGAGFGGRKK